MAENTSQETLRTQKKTATANERRTLPSSFEILLQIIVISGRTAGINAHSLIKQATNENDEKSEFSARFQLELRYIRWEVSN